MYFDMLLYLCYSGTASQLDAESYDNVEVSSIPMIKTIDSESESDWDNVSFSSSDGQSPEVEPNGRFTPRCSLECGVGHSWWRCGGSSFG